MSTSHLSRQPYQGSKRKLVLALDVGTTYSGISYCVLDPGELPQIRGVNRFPGQENVGGDSKIPTVVYYNKSGTVCAAGAEALHSHVLEMATEQEWVKVEWFKLHLRPRSSHIHDHDLPPLPPNKTAVDVFADFFGYLYQCAREYVLQTHVNGADLWKSVQSDIEFVLTHPNGWEGMQQCDMRRSAVLGGLIPDTTEGQNRIRFVTEGEASLHFCVGSGFASEALESGQGVMIVDAGGGTIDVSTYAKTPSPSSFEEIAAPECHLQGSVFVSRRAASFLKEKLQGCRFGGPEDIQHMTLCFDKTTKLSFRTIDTPSYIKFGTARDQDIEFSIRFGQLKLQGSDIAALFEPSVQAIIEAIERQRANAHKRVSTVLLVGGFAASDWIFNCVQKYLRHLNLSFCRPDSHLNKAVADGAVSFYLDHLVSARVSRFNYGTSCCIDYRWTNPEHFRRRDSIFTHPSGDESLPDGYNTILPKGQRVSEETEFRKQYTLEAYDTSSLEYITEDILCYVGKDEQPKWTDVEPEMFRTLCTVTLDDAQSAHMLRPKFNRKGEKYYLRNFDIVLLFGLTELKAHVSWYENGKETRSPARIVYDPPASAL